MSRARRRGQRRQHERRQRAAPGEPVHGANEERPARERPAADVDVRGHAGVDVHDVPVLVDMWRTGRSLTGRLADGPAPERRSA